APAHGRLLLVLVGGYRGPGTGVVPPLAAPAPGAPARPDVLHPVMAAGAPGPGGYHEAELPARYRLGGEHVGAGEVDRVVVGYHPGVHERAVDGGLEDGYKLTRSNF